MRGTPASAPASHREATGTSHSRPATSRARFPAPSGDDRDTFLDAHIHAGEKWRQLAQSYLDSSSTRTSCVFVLR